jgi:hypothetical protein
VPHCPSQWKCITSDDHCRHVDDKNQPWPHRRILRGSGTPDINHHKIIIFFDGMPTRRISTWFFAHSTLCSSIGEQETLIREGKSPDDKKNSAFSTKFFANFHYFCVLFPSSRRNSTKPQHFTMHHYSAKQHSGIIYYISQQSHVTHQLVLWNLVVIHIIIVVTHETIDGQPRRQYIFITFGLAYGSQQPFSLAHSTT